MYSIFQTVVSAADKQQVKGTGSGRGLILKCSRKRGVLNERKE